MGSSRRESLTRFLESAASEPFRWGDRDCITFANQAVRVQRGHGFVDDLLTLRQHTTELGALRLWQMAQKQTGCTDIVDLLDARLTRSPRLYPQTGSVVARPLAEAMVFSHAIGIMGVRGPVYMTPEGFQRFRLDGDLSWEI